LVTRGYSLSPTAPHKTPDIPLGFQALPARRSPEFGIERFVYLNKFSMLFGQLQKGTQT
jgi:hypothetical protein